MLINKTTYEKKEISPLRLMISAFLKLVMFLLLVFWAAGTWDYWQGWLFIGITLSLTIVILIIFRKRTSLFKERLKPGPGVKWWDKIILTLFTLLFFLTMVISILDSGRYGWTTNFPLWLYIVSYIFHVGSYFLVLWPMWVNDYFSSMVRIQKDRGQKVIDFGPYKIVRHPGYSSIIIMAPTISLVFGSYWGLIPAVFMIILIIIRTALEDKTLQKELEGYQEYTKKTKYRLIPYIW